MRWWVAAWVILALSATAYLGVAGAKVGRWPEGAHLFGHLMLCGGLAFGVAMVARGTPTQRGWAAVAGGVSFGVAIEVIQARFHPVWVEAGFDLCMDTLGAVIGMLLWGRLQPGPGHVASAVLHPLWVAPVGLLMLVGPEPTARMGACLLPAITLWAVGIRRSWWVDADVSKRSQRAPLFAVGCLAMAAFLGLSWGGPSHELALVLIGAAFLGSGITAAGLKVSGHVGIPAVLGVWAMHDLRAAQWLLGSAVLLSWARWVSTRHQWVEIAAAWGLAAFVGAAMSLVQRL